jgi:RimJ/RimL family protein N-acetyltransferase
MSIYKEGIQIGYGGLVHISWENSRAEISFLLDPSIPETGKTYFEIFRNFLVGIENVAISSLKLHKLILETYNFRENHIKAIGSAGYLQEGVLTDHVLINGKWYDSILHGKVIE